MMKLRAKEQIPALTGQIGHALPVAKAQKFRIWVHPKRGDDYFYEYKNLSDAILARVRLRKAGLKTEPIIGAAKMKVAKFPTQKYWEFRIKEGKRIL